MISSDYILKWRDSAPWPDIDFVEQDLVISRALVTIYQSQNSLRSWRFVVELP